MNTVMKTKMKNIFRLLLAATLLLTCLSACGKAEGTAAADASETAEENAGTITLLDMYGREVSLTEPVTRAVALTAADCEIIYALGAGDILVGRGEYCNYPAEVSDLPAVQSGAQTSIEQILALSPQVVFMGGMEQTQQQIAQLESAGVHVIESDADDIEGVYTSIRMIGSALGKNAEAETLISSMESVFDEIKAHPFPSGSSVYFEVSPLEWGLWTAGKGSFMDEVATMMGLKNCFDDVEGWAQISEEQVLERNPDFIVTVTMYSGEGATPEQEILARNGWEKVSAVRNNAVLNLENDELTRPGPRLADGAKLLYEFVAGYIDAM